MAVTRIILFQFLILAAAHLLMAENDHHGEKEGDDRFFFNPAVTFSSCNYTATPGRSCLSCNRTQSCLQNNLAIVRVCRGRAQYCDNGMCVRTPTAACNATANSTNSI